MKLKLNEPKILSDAISIISELVTEVRAKVSKNGLNIIAIDPANVALVILKIPSSSFSEFEMSKEAEKEEELGLNLDDLKAVLRRCGSGSLIMERDGNMLKIQIQDKTRRNFNLALIDIDSEDKKIPNLEFSSKVDISSDILAEAIEDAAIVADSCTFETKKKESQFIIEAKGSLNSARIEFSDEVKMSDSNAKSKFSLEYLQKFIKAARIADKCSIQLGNDYPMRMDFKSSAIELGFIIAPRMEEAEED